MGQSSSKMLISPVWVISLLRPWRFLSLFGMVFGHFFGLFPSVPIATRKMPGVVIIKGPLTAHYKKKVEPWTLILVILALLSKVR